MSHYQFREIDIFKRIEQISRDIKESKRDIKEIRHCLIGGLDGSDGLIDQVRLNTRFRHNAIKAIWAALISALGAITYWIKDKFVG